VAAASPRFPGAPRRVLVIEPFWGRPSNRFLERHLEMLADRGALAAVAVLYPTLRRSWRGIPVVSLSDAASTAGRGRWLARALLRRVGLTPSWLGGDLPTDCGACSGDPGRRRPCQYATTAAALWEPLQAARSDLFVHLHGADTVESMCPAGHRERLLEIASRALIICNSQQTRRVWPAGACPISAWWSSPLGVEVPVRVPEPPASRRSPCSTRDAWSGPGSRRTIRPSSVPASRAAGPPAAGR
jgi:hypothetical protein